MARSVLMSSANITLQCQLRFNLTWAFFAASSFFFLIRTSGFFFALMMPWMHFSLPALLTRPGIDSLTHNFLWDINWDVCGWNTSDGLEEWAIGVSQFVFFSLYRCTWQAQVLFQSQHWTQWHLQLDRRQRQEEEPPWRHCSTTLIWRECCFCSGCCCCQFWFCSSMELWNPSPS